MLNKFNKIPDYSGHNIYVGLDVHKASWSAAFLDWLKQLSLPEKSGTLALEYLLIAYENTRAQL